MAFGAWVGEMDSEAGRAGLDSGAGKCEDRMDTGFIVVQVLELPLLYVIE